MTDLLCSNNRVLWHVGKALLYFQGVLGPPQDEVKAAERVRVLQEEATASLEALIVVSDTLVHPVSQSNWGYSHWYESGVAQEGSSLRYSPSGEGFVNLVRHTQNEGDKEDKFYLCEGKIRTRQYAKDGHKVVAEVQAFYLDRGDGRSRIEFLNNGWKHVYRSICRKTYEYEYSSRKKSRDSEKSIYNHQRQKIWSR